MYIVHHVFEVKKSSNWNIHKLNNAKLRQFDKLFYKSYLCG